MNFRQHLTRKRGPGTNAFGLAMVEVALGKLQSANHAALRAGQVGPGESVTKFGQVELPAD